MPLNFLIVKDQTFLHRLQHNIGEGLVKLSLKEEWIKLSNLPFVMTVNIQSVSLTEGVVQLSEEEQLIKVSDLPSVMRVDIQAVTFT